MSRRIVFLNPVGTLGGAERSLLDMLAILRAARPSWPLHVITAAAGPLCDEAAGLGAAVDVVPMPEAIAGFGESGLRGTADAVIRAAIAGLHVPAYLRKLRRVLARIRPGLIHSNGLKFHLLAGYAAPRGVPVLWHIHDFLTSRRILGRWLRWLARRPTVAVANSHATTADAAKALPGTRIETVYYGIDTDHFTPGRGDAAEPGTARVGLVATYARWKGQDVFIDAVAELAAALPQARFVIVGGPVYQTAGSQFSEAELRYRIAARGLTDRVALVPFQRDTAPVYRGLDIVVHASTRPEPFGLTIVEAMACGRAVIVANAGGAAELFTEGVDAVGVPPGDPVALANAIRRLVTDPNLRQTLGTDARQTAVARFSRDQMAGRLLAVYDSITS